jgi:hypothetical protein
MFGVKAAAAAEVHRAAWSTQGNEGMHRAHSGIPAFPRPSISSFAFDWYRRGYGGMVFSAYDDAFIEVRYAPVTTNSALRRNDAMGQYRK